jgi:matrixin
MFPIEIASPVPPTTVKMRCAAVFLCAALILTFGSRVDADAPDYFVRTVPDAAVAPASPRRVPEFQFSFGTPARWSGKLVNWQYNRRGAPGPFSTDPAATAQKIIAASSKWSAVCGVRFTYGGETASPPNNVIGGQPDRVNVVGWESLPQGTAGVTNSWNTLQSLVDADMSLNSDYLVSAGELDRTATHEWGHMLGLGHSNLSDALLSGPPDSSYNNRTELTLDDVRGCRCLYGAAANQLAGYACSLPSSVKFGSQAVGTSSPPHRITLTNDATASAPLTVFNTAIASGEFFVSAVGCAVGTALAPGTGCTIDLVARPAVTGTRTAELVISTSDGPYRVPLEVNGSTDSPAAVNYQGLWWNAPAESESGWGINFAHQDDVIFATWFTYDVNGKGRWLTMQAERTAPNAFVGPLYESRGPPFNAVPFNPNAKVSTLVGSGTLTFSDVTNGTFASTVNGIQQTKAVTRQVFGPLPTCTSDAQANLALATNYQDLWWAAPARSEDGWGINFAHEGDIIFASWFTYDLNGAPLWLVVTANRMGPGVYAGELYRTEGPAFNAFDPTKRVTIPAGTATFTFADGNSATFAYTVTGVAPTPVTQVKAITRQVFHPPGTVCH